MAKVRPGVRAVAGRDGHDDGHHDGASVVPTDAALSASLSGDRPLKCVGSLSALRLAEVDVQVGRDGEPGMA